MIHGPTECFFCGRMIEPSHQKDYVGYFCRCGDATMILLSDYTILRKNRKTKKFEPLFNNEEREHKERAIKRAQKARKVRRRYAF